MTNAVSENAGAVSPYLEQVERCLDRARGLVDRDHSSPSFGSCDRVFWYYRTIVDFPGAAWQQLMLGFSALATNESLSRTEREQLGLLARATLARWTAVQHRDGSFDEWYRNERSYCATAFTAAGAAQALLLLGGAVPADGTTSNACRPGASCALALTPLSSDRDEPKLGCRARALVHKPSDEH